MNRKNPNYNNIPETVLSGLLEDPAPLLPWQWWQYGIAAGWVLPPLALAGYLTGYSGTLFLAVSLHLLLDFVVQTPETAENKAEGKAWAIIYHSLITGFFAALPLGLTLAVASAGIHLVIDACRKFGIAGWRGGLLDQSLHLATLIVLWLMS